MQLYIMKNLKYSQVVKGKGKIITLIACCLMFCSSQAQQKGKMENLNSAWKTFKGTNQSSATELSQNRTALSLSENDTLKLIATTKDDFDYKHYRYHQTYKGIPIEGAVYLIHEKQGKVKLSNGTLVKRLNVKTQASISENEARQLAIKHTVAEQHLWQYQSSSNNLLQGSKSISSSRGSLVIVDPRFTHHPANYRLAYKFQVVASKPFLQNEMYVDAHNGEILLIIDNIHSCTESTVNAPTQYSGEVDVSVCLQDNAIKHTKSSLYGGLEVRDFTNNDLLLIDDTLATEVLWATQKTFQYFKEHHNRNIEDSTTVSKINYAGDFFGAFYYSGLGEIVYCDGNGTTHNAYTTPDIVGHELTHGVNKFSANLNNRYEPGALNESFADIFGILVEAYSTGSINWVFGDRVTPTHQGIRNLADPKDETMKTQQPNTYLGEFWRTPSSACIQNNDYCGVHKNSGVQNYWFYLLANGGAGINDNGINYNIEAIGIEKAAQIAYRNLTTYLTPTATFIDARQGSIQAAIDWFGPNSFEVQQTKNAWRAVGVDYNPIKIQTVNEGVLQDGTVQFELLVDSLDQPLNGDGLTIKLDVQQNYDILSVELINDELLLEEVDIDLTNNNEISINRINAQSIDANEPLFKIVAALNNDDHETAFNITGGTTMQDGGFVPFEDVLLTIPINNCSDGENALNAQTALKNINQSPLKNIRKNASKNILSTPNIPNNALNNGLPLIISIKNESCVEESSVIVKTLNTKNGPFAHIWRDIEGTIVFEFVGYEQEVEVPSLKPGIYTVTVSDTGGNCTTTEVKIRLLTGRDGNNLCANRCPEYLITPNANLQGSYKAKTEIEVIGYVGQHKNASFNICN